MSLLELYVGKSKYTIECDDSEKEKVTSLAAKLNQRVNSLSLQMRGADEKTILMLSSIMIEEELESLKNNSKSLGSKTSAEKSVQTKTNDVKNTIFYIEDLVNKIKSY